MDRRRFLVSGLSLASATAMGAEPEAAEAAARKFPISLAQWSLHKAFFGKQLDPLDFAKVARTEYGVDGLEYVNQFFKDKATDKNFLAELKKRASDHGLKNVLIMIDGEGQLGHPEESKRIEAVNNHHKWVDAAKYLGCHSIRVNAYSTGTWDEQRDRAADGLARLTEYGNKQRINIIVENHGGLSSNGKWLSEVMRKVGQKRCGTLPDFGNFRVAPNEEYDRYQGVAEMMPFAKGVSAKTNDFNEQGDEIHTDYVRMMKIVKDAGYNGFVGIEYEGSKLSEPEGIKATKRLLERIRETW
ncbi:MAG: sugar phosphate isomerase/epimerase family protein [Armatimonadaceae bacterium]